MIFVDTNVLLMCTVGRSHPLRPEAEAFPEAAFCERTPLATSAEMLQELLDDRPLAAAFRRL